MMMRRASGYESRMSRTNRARARARSSTVGACYQLDSGLDGTEPRGPWEFAQIDQGTNGSPRTKLKAHTDCPGSGSQSPPLAPPARPGETFQSRMLGESTGGHHRVPNSPKQINAFASSIIAAGAAPGVDDVSSRLLRAPSERQIAVLIVSRCRASIFSRGWRWRS